MTESALARGESAMLRMEATLQTGCFEKLRCLSLQPGLRGWAISVISEDASHATPHSCQFYMN